MRAKNKQTKMKSLFSLVFVFMVAGCATPVERVARTESGRPEIIIRAEISAIKSAIVSHLIGYGYTLTKDSDVMLEMTRTTNGAETLSAAMTIGNAYSSNRRVETFTLLRTDAGIRVIEQGRLESTMPGGATNSAPINSNETFNIYQKWFEEIKTKLEAASPAAK